MGKMVTHAQSCVVYAPSHLWEGAFMPHLVSCNFAWVCISISLPSSYALLHSEVRVGAVGDVLVRSVPPLSHEGAR